MITPDEINAAYERMSHAIDDLATVTEKLIVVRETLEHHRMLGLSDGTIVGKNPDERSASARSVLAPLFVDLEKAEYQERQAKLEFDLARLEVERVRALLRLAEVTAKIEV